jgi:hypothetical protein
MDAETNDIIELIKANARLLFSRNYTYHVVTYDVVTSQGPSPASHAPLPVACAYLMCYHGGSLNMLPE